jgi:hypothetical protein
MWTKGLLLPLPRKKDLGTLKNSNLVISLPFFVKYLGFIVDKELTWNLQSENANKKGFRYVEVKCGNTL